MKTSFNGVIALSGLLLGSPVMASATRVIINLSDQRVWLVQQGRITLGSPIGSGKPEVFENRKWLNLWIGLRV